MKKVLIICTGNSFRSHIAEGLLKHFAGDKFEVYSAGINPTQVNSLAIKVMAEISVDISKQRSKSVTEFLGQQFDYIITVCDNAKQTCPIFPGKYQKIHWNIEDPATFEGTQEEKLEKIRIVRDKIKIAVEQFIKEN